jgi:hypothetical protein
MSPSEETPWIRAAPINTPALRRTEALVVHRIIRSMHRILYDSPRKKLSRIDWVGADDTGDSITTGLPDGTTGGWTIGSRGATEMDT